MRDREYILSSSVALLLLGCPSTEVVVGGSSDTSSDDGTGGGDGDGDGDPGGDVVENHRTYFIGESTKFNGGGECDNAELNWVTSTLRDKLVDAGWTGQRFTDENTWPEDFHEGTFSDTGLDGSFADASRLAVYAGHGASGRLQWGTPSANGTCQTSIADDSRWGTLAGDTAAAVMLLASCTMRADRLWPVYQNQMSRQIFGYHNSPYIGHDEVRKVFKRTEDGQSTTDAWLEEMVLNGLGKNSPVVLTKGTSVEEAMAMHDATNLASGMGFLENVPEPADAFWFELHDSGCTKTCGACSGNASAPPEITLGSSVPLVELSRPTRSARDLVERVNMGLTLFGIAALDDAEAARLRAWATSTASRGDITYAVVLEHPRIDVSYDPASDFLRITNRDALARARPRPGQNVDDPSDLPDALLLEAENVRAGLQAVPGGLDLLDTQFEVTKRVVGHGHGDAPPIVTAYEYMFTLPGRLESLALPDRHLGIGVTRLGELSTLTVSQIEVEIVGSSRIQRLPQHAIADLVAQVLAQYPSATDVEIVEPRIGYQLVEGRPSAVAVPSLLVGHVVQFGDVASRRFPVYVSLAEPNAPIESLAAVDPNPTPGDDRVSP